MHFKDMKGGGAVILLELTVSVPRLGSASWSHGLSGWPYEASCSPCRNRWWCQTPPRSRPSWHSAGRWSPMSRPLCARRHFSSWLRLRGGTRESHASAGKRRHNLEGMQVLTQLLDKGHKLLVWAQRQHGAFVRGYVGREAEILLEIKKQSWLTLFAFLRSNSLCNRREGRQTA